MVISTGKEVHLISHPEACGGGLPGLRNTGVSAEAHVHHSCQYSLIGIRARMSAEDDEQHNTGHTDGSLGGLSSSATLDEAKVSALCTTRGQWGSGNPPVARRSSTCDGKSLSFVEQTYEVELKMHVTICLSAGYS